MSKDMYAGSLVIVIDLASLVRNNERVSSLAAIGR
jgi:hypothetical protein